MTYLITGASGFVGHYLIRFILESEIDSKVIGTSRNKDVSIKNDRFELVKINLNDQDLVIGLVKKYKPDYVIHLAAESSVSFSWENPIESFFNNVNIFLNLIEGIRKTNTNCRVLSVGSSEGYGIVQEDDLPLSEESPLNPISPYATARVSQELLSKVYVEGYGLDIIMTRSFNHFGPGQDRRFVIPSFVRQIIDSKKMQSIVPIQTGDLSIVRDFVDVRDVVIAYLGLLKKGIKGEIYNVCSGKGLRLNSIVDMICDLLSYEVSTEINKKFLRPNDNPVIIGDNRKLKLITGWMPQYSAIDTLKDVIDNMQSSSNEN